MLQKGYLPRFMLTIPCSGSDVTKFGDVNPKLLTSNYMTTADAKDLFPIELKPRTDQPELAL
jgi:hypothetical protein